MTKYHAALTVNWKSPLAIFSTFITTFQYALALLLMIAISPAPALEALDDQEMEAVAGREGVMVSMEYYYNSVRTDDSTTTGAGLAKCSNGGLADMDCRLAWQLSNRGDAGAAGIYGSTTWTLPGGGGCNGQSTCKGEWLVWKAGWASLSVNDLMLDAATLSDAGSSGAAYESWLTPNLVGVYGSFVDSNGTCLMPVGPSDGGAACSVAYMKAMPALRTHYPNTSGTYNSGTRATTGFNDVRFGLEVTGLSAEYDCATAATAGCGVSAAAGPGWMLNNGGSFTSLKIADNAGNQAGIAFGGNFYLYGF